MADAKNSKCSKRLINRQLLQVSGLCGTLFFSYLPKRSTQIYRAQYGPSEGHQHGGRKSMKTSGTHFCYHSDYSSLVSLYTYT